MADREPPAGVSRSTVFVWRPDPGEDVSALVRDCRAVIRDGLPATVPAVLDERHERIPLCVDVNGDVAAVAFATRLAPEAEASLGRREPVALVLVLHWRDGEWEIRGGGSGGTLRTYPLTARTTALPRNRLRIDGAGGRPLDADRGRYAFFVRLRVDATVERLRVGGRLIDVPFHGNAMVVWSGESRPWIHALDAEGRVLVIPDLSRHAEALRPPRARSEP